MQVRKKTTQQQNTIMRIISHIINYYYNKYTVTRGQEFCVPKNKDHKYRRVHLNGFRWRRRSLQDPPPHCEVRTGAGPPQRRRSQFRIQNPEIKLSDCGIWFWSLSPLCGTFDLSDRMLVWCLQADLERSCTIIGKPNRENATTSGSGLCW